MVNKTHENALKWLKAQGDKAFQNQAKKEVDSIAYLVKEISKPDYEQIIITLGKVLRDKGNINYTDFAKIAPNPNAKPKTINIKPNK